MSAFAFVTCNYDLTGPSTVSIVIRDYFRVIISGFTLALDDLSHCLVFEMHACCLFVLQGTMLAGQPLLIKFPDNPLTSSGGALIEKPTKR